MLAASSLMNFSHFMRIERKAAERTQHFVVHTHDPKLSVEFSPDPDASERPGKGVIRKICVPNSWAGNYSQYSKLIAAAEAFFLRSQENPAAKEETRRFQG